jgi:uncharacterized protein
MKIITTIVVVGIIISFYFLQGRSQPAISLSPSILPISATVTPNTNHPLSIESLRARQFPYQTLKTVREITPTSRIVSYLADDLTLNALLITPSGTPPTNGWPVVIVNHGHIPPDQYSTARSYINTSNYFASSGFIVLKPDYRGHDQSDGESSGRLLARSEYAVDVLSLLSAIDSLPQANPKKIFMYGHSMGGEVTLQVLETSTRVIAATLWAPSVTNLPQQVTHFMNRSRPTPGQAEKFQDQYESFIKQYPVSQITSIENLDKVSVPLNLHHGTNDESVPYSWGTTLNGKLKENGNTVNFYSYSGDNHDISRNFGKALSKDVEFFKSFVD